MYFVCYLSGLVKGINPYAAPFKKVEGWSNVSLTLSRT